MKTQFRNEYFTRTKKILKTSLNSKNTIQAINTFAVPAISYGFQVLDWSITELQDIDRETRNLLRKNHMVHGNSDTDRLYLPRTSGGRGLLNITDLYKSQIMTYSHYLKQTTECLMLLVSTTQTDRGAKSIHRKAVKYLEELNIDQDYDQTMKQLKNIIKTNRVNKKRRNIQDKAMHGQYFNILDEPHIDKTASLAWLKSSSLKRSTESTLCAIQEQAITTRYTMKHIHNTYDDDICRACKRHKETIHHVISACPILAPTKYIERHDNVCRYIHLCLARKFDLLQEYPPWYKYDPEPLLENENVKILWNFPVQTDRRVAHNKPDILMVNKKEREISIIDIAVPNDSNISRKRYEKITNYADLAIELRQLWDARTVKTVPIIIIIILLFHNLYTGYNRNQ